MSTTSRREFLRRSTVAAAAARLVIRADYVTVDGNGATRDARWDLSQCKQLSFWIKFQNPNPTGFQDAGPVVLLEGPKGQIVYTPAAARPTRRGRPDPCTKTDTNR